MIEASLQVKRVVVIAAMVWSGSFGATWWLYQPGMGLVGLKPTAMLQVDVKQLEPRNLETERSQLERTNLWGMQRDGLAPSSAPTVVAVEKQINWLIAATVVRPKQRYVVVLDQDTKQATQISVGEKLPDGSTLLRVGPSSYEVRSPSGKKRTVETSL